MKDPTTPPANVLVRAPADCQYETETCGNLLTPIPSEGLAVLHVTLTQSPDERQSMWHEHAGRPAPARTGFIAVGEQTRSASSTTAASSVDGSAPVSMISVPEDGDLSSLRTAIETVLAAWDGQAVQVVACFHSLTTLIDRVGVDAATPFLRSVTTSVESAEASAHYHFDDSGYDPTSVRRLESLFDAVRTPDGAVPAARSDRPSPSGREPRVFNTTIDANERPSEAVIRGVATIEGVDPVDLDATLYEAVDAEELDTILCRRGRPDDVIRIEFPFGGYRVAVTEGAVTLREDES